MKEQLIKKVRSKSAIIGVIGLGYVGLPLTKRFLEAGFHVIGFDIDQTKVDQLYSGKSYLKHINHELLFHTLQSTQFEVTSDYKRTFEPDVLIICVPTPLGNHHDPDLSYVINTLNSLIPNLRNGQLISLESTTYPGTTEEEIRPRLEKQGFTVGEDIFLVYSPEREDPGNQHFSTQMIPKVVGGTTKVCLEIGKIIYESIIDTVVPVSSTSTAEMTKLLENIYRAVNISLINEIKIITDRMGIDVWEVIDAASTKPFGFTPFYPGPGLGGHCIPIDPFYLTWKAKEYGISTHFIELAGEINTKMPEWVVNKVIDALNDREKPIKNSKVLVLGIAYKKNIDDTRESPAVEIMQLLKEKGARVSYFDPHVPFFPKMRNYEFDLKSIATLNSNVLSEYDCVVLATNHDYFDYEMIQKNSSLIIDTRGCYRQKFPNVVKA
jgi:UDP-N-acetyl-D-glucosamine dehydrogenase